MKLLAVHVWFPNGEVRRISPPIGHYLQASIHPNGTHAVYWGGGIGSAGIWRTNLANFRIERITSMASGSWHPSFGAVSDRGDEIVFASDRFGDHRADDMNDMIERIEQGGAPQLVRAGHDGPDGHDLQSHVYLASADGRRWHGLTRGPYHDEHPALSPDGGRVAFVSNREGDGGLWLAPTAEDAETEPTPLVTDVAASHPSWAPDGETIYFAAPIDGDSRLCVVPSDASDDGAWLPLDAETAGLENPCIDPDGARLLAHSSGDDRPMLVEVPLDGGEPRPLHPPGFDVALHPSRSRDGVIVFDAPVE
ncbi:MAG: LpqB family beta-propeller domain-containing protein [Dehalococcoidia bacterium]